ncbi:MAG: hypothetical protein HPY61_07680 [Methanotrichaceae archaeon]|nr:hypothetical protein [Methanotrichaceae archaeon]
MTGPNDFIIKEYEKLYDLYRIHYDTSQKISYAYLLILGGFLLILSLVYNDSMSVLNFCALNDLALFSLLIIIIVGFCMFMMLVEHKMKIILYARCMNAIRRWFCDANPSFKPYLLLPTDVNVPKHFVIGKDFFWEIISFGVLNSIITSLGITNLLNRWQIPYFNCSELLFFFSLILIVLHILLYAWRGTTSIIQGYNLPDFIDNQE